jgi:hypothetical protein
MAESENPDAAIRQARGFSKNAEAHDAEKEGNPQAGTDDGDGPTISDEKEVPDNPPKAGVSVWVIALLALAVCGIGGFVGFKLTSKGKKEE